jgi:pre-mRNA-processing factor 19
VQIYDRPSNKVLATIKGHTKKITTALLVNPQGGAAREDGSLPPLVASASFDKTVRLWSATEDAKKPYVNAATFSQHSAEVTGLSLHPSHTLLASSSLDNTFAIHDLGSSSNYQTIISLALPPADGADAASIKGATDVAFHPDGAILSVGGGDGLIRVFDVRSAKLAAVFSPPEGALSGVGSLSFSENGYLLASSSPVPASPVQIWDLRKLSLVKAIGGGVEGQIVNRVRFDPSAQFLAAVGTEARVYAHRTWEELFSWDGNTAELTSAAWAKEGRELVVGGLDRSLRVLGKPSA